MYSNKIAVAIKANGKALREFEDQVYLPFQTEYSIYIKNKNSVRASVKVEIDGVDATQGVSLVVDPNDEIELERFIKNGNLDRGNRFKFIKRTLAVERNRGVKIEDGLVRVEFQFEKKIETIITINNLPWTYYPPYQPPYIPSPSPWHPAPWHPTLSPVWCRNTPTTGVEGNVGPGGCASSMYSSNSSNSSNSVSANCSSEVGITAPGSISDQEFSHVSSFQLDSLKHVMILHLLGEHLGKSVSKTVTTRSRTSCVTCGHRNNSSVKFCPQCGTSLKIIN